MKRTIYGSLILLLFAACSKKELARPGSASLLIVHAVPDAQPMFINFSHTPPPVFGTANLVIYANLIPSTIFHDRIPGNVPLTLYHRPDTMPKSEPLYKLNFDLPESSMHSLYLTGSLTAPEYVLLKDEPLYLRREDSAMGIRFVNMLTDNISVSINQSTKAHGSETNLLDFKKATAFKKYDVKMNLDDYTFEFRNAGTGTLIASITTAGIANDGKQSPNTWIYRNFAMALVGKLNGTGTAAPKIILVPYARN